MSTLTIATNTNWSGLEDVSTTSAAVSFAIKTLTVSAGKSWTTGMPLAMTAVGTKLHTCMLCPSITSYSGTTLTMTPNGFTSSANDSTMIPSMWGQFANQAFSQSSVVVGSSGTKVFWTRPNLTLVFGNAIRAVNRGANATFIEGTVASYHAATGNLVMTATSSNGSGTVSDWVIVSAGTFSNWIIHPVHNDTVSVSNGMTLTIDQTNYGLPANVVANGTGQIYIPNVSTSGPIAFRLSCRAHTTNYGRITVQQNGTFKTRGNYVEIATGTGSALSYTFPSQWDAMSAPTLVEVETAAGTGVYERWPTIGSMFYGLNRYGHIYGGDIGKTPTNLLIKWAGGGTGVGTLGTIVGGTGYGGVLSTLGTLTGGTGGTQGTYTNVPLTVSSGTVGNGATANITVYGGAVVAVQIVNPGCGYTATSALSAATGNIGNTTGFSTTAVVLTSWIFSNVPLTGGTGTGATAHITVALGVVTAVEIVNSGTGYTAANSLSASTTLIGAGTSFSVPITIIGVPTGTFKCSGGSGANGIITITSVNTGGIGRLGTITGGSGYVNGTYNDVPMTATTSSTGAGARVNIVVSGGAVTSVTLITTGYGYATNTGITTVNTFLGGSGSGFTVTASALANSLQGAYFSGYDGTPSPYAVGDLLTIECGGSMKPVLYVAEVGDFASTTPATNVLNSITETIPTQLTGYQQYHVYGCNGGSGTGAKYTVFNGGTNTRTIGSQYGYFISGTGYAVDDIITVGEFGFQVRVLEVQNTLPVNFTNKVCSWDPAGRTLRLGGEPDSAPVPVGAKVRVPNIIIDALPVEIPLIQSVTEANPTWYFESSVALGTTIAVNATAHCDYENISYGTKSSNTLPIAVRGVRGTRKATHPAGSIVTVVPAGRGTGNNRAQFNTSAGGELDIDITMFGYWFMFSSSATRNISATNVGWSGALIHGTTTGPVTIDKFCNSCHPFQVNEHQWSVNAIQNSFSLSNGVCAQVKAADATTSEVFINVTNCPTITKFSNLDVFTAREWQGANRSIAIGNSFFTNDTTAIPQYIRLVGGMMYISAMANFRMHHISFGANCCRTVSSITPASSFTYLNTSYSNAAFMFTNSSNIIAHNIDTVAQPIKGDLVYSDAGCANILVHTGNNSLSGVTGYIGNGAFAGINLSSRILGNTGLNVKVANLHVSNLRSPFSYVANNTQTANIVQNIRTPIALTNQNGTQTDYTSTTLNFRSSSGNGLGHGSLDSYDYVTGYTPYWSTGGSMTPNLPDATWFMNLVDQGMTPSTGRITIGCGGPNSNKTQYVVTGSNDSYPDNGGRFFIGQSNDIVEFTNWYPLRGITGFESVNPFGSFSAAVQNITDGWYRYTLTSGGAGYASGTLYTVTGGSGYGGAYYVNAQSGGVIISGSMQTGIGYQVGDVLDVGGLGGVITLTAIKTVQVSMVPWGQDITTATYADLTYANLQASFAAMVGYDSNKGLQIQMNVANDSNAHDLQGHMNMFELFTTVDPSFNPPIGYTDIELTGLQSGSRIAAYSGVSLLDSSVSTTIGTLTVPYSFDGVTMSADVVIGKYGYTKIDYSQDYGKDTVNKSILQAIDERIFITDEATVAAYTDLSNTNKIYDYIRYWESLEENLLIQLCTNINDVLVFGSYDLVFDATASEVLTLVGNTITFKTSELTHGDINTTGSATFINGSLNKAFVNSSEGKSGKVTVYNGDLDGYKIYLEDDMGVELDYVAVSGDQYDYYFPAGSTGIWTWRAVKYGMIPETGTVYVGNGAEQGFNIEGIADSSMTQPDLSVVLAYSILETWDKFYDYCQAYLTTSNGRKLGQFVNKNGAAVDITGYSLLVNGSAGTVFNLSGSAITIKITILNVGVKFAGAISNLAVTTSNGGVINTWYTSLGVRSVLILAPNIMQNSRAWLFNENASSTIDNSIVSTGGIYVRTNWTSDITVRLTTTCLDCQPIVTTGIMTDTGLTFLSTQVTDEVYGLNNIVGASCDSSNGGEFTADLPNVQIDINDSDNTTSLARLYAWSKYFETTSSGIILFLNTVTAIDTANYFINGNIVNVSFDNKKSTLLTINGGYISKTGGSSLVSSTTTGSIYFDSAKAYVAPSLTSGATIGQIEASSILAKEATVASRLAASSYVAPDNSSITSIKTKTDQLVFASGRVNAAIDTTLLAKTSDVVSAQTSLAVLIGGIPTTPLLTSDSRLNNLDVTISSRLASSSYTTPPTTGAIVTAVEASSILAKEATSSKIKGIVSTLL